MDFSENVCIDAECWQPRPEDPLSCDFGYTPAGHRPQRARPTDHRPQRHPAWLWGSTARSALRTTSLDAYPSETVPLNRLDLARIIQNRDTTFNLELDIFVIRADQNRFAVGQTRL